MERLSGRYHGQPERQAQLLIQHSANFWVRLWSHVLLVYHTCQSIIRYLCFTSNTYFQDLKVRKQKQKRNPDVLFCFCFVCLTKALAKHKVKRKIVSVIYKEKSISCFVSQSHSYQTQKIITRADVTKYQLGTTRTQHGHQSERRTPLHSTPGITTTTANILRQANTVDTVEMAAFQLFIQKNKDTSCMEICLVFFPITNQH